MGSAKLQAGLSSVALYNLSTSLSPPSITLLGVLHQSLCAAFLHRSRSLLVSPFRSMSRLSSPICLPSRNGYPTFNCKASSSPWICLHLRVFCLFYGFDLGSALLQAWLCTVSSAAIVASSFSGSGSSFVWHFEHSEG